MCVLTLVCEAPESWSKYTTPKLKPILNLGRNSRYPCLETSLKPVLSFFSEHSFVPRTAPLFGLHDDGCRIFHQVTYSQTFLGFLLASQCNRIEMLTGPLACLCLSSFDLVDKNQDSQSGTWSLMLLFPGCK